MQYACPLKFDYHFNNCNTTSGDTFIFVAAAVSDLSTLLNIPIPLRVKV